MALSTDDLLEIQQLYARYNHAIDLGDTAAWAATFTPDGEFKGGNSTSAGTEQLVTFAEGFKSNFKGRARHWNSNLVVDPAPGGATGSCYLMLLRLAEEGKPPSIITTAIYHDELTKGSGGWKFSRRTAAPD